MKSVLETCDENLEIAFRTSAWNQRASFRYFLLFQPNSKMNETFEALVPNLKLFVLNFRTLYSNEDNIATERARTIKVIELENFAVSCINMHKSCSILKYCSSCNKNKCNCCGLEQVGLLGNIFYHLKIIKDKLHYISLNKRTDISIIKHNFPAELMLGFNDIQVSIENIQSH